ncbi:MAG: hypothetical protein KIS90_05625 [Phenylobacterium sp.]|nr:hypothetical protein [Phenylobacterium sp.]
MYQLPVWVWPTALMLVCALAVWRGRDDERLAAGAYLAAWALTLVVFRARSEETQWAVMVIDTGLLGVFLWQSLRTDRFWPLFASAFQFLSVVTHLASGLDASVSGWAYQTAGLVWAYLIIAVIGYGAWTAPHAAESADVDPIEAPGAIRR